MKLPKSIIIAGFALLTAFCPVFGQSEMNSMHPQAQSDVAEIRFYVKGSSVRVVNAAKQTLQVFSIAGSCVASYNIDSEDKTFNLNLMKGIYILKVGEVARRIVIR